MHNFPSALLVLLSAAVFTPQARPPERVDAPTGAAVPAQPGNSAADSNKSVSGDPARGESSEVTLAARPDGAIFIAWVDFRKGTRCGFVASQDGGKTWGAPTYLQPLAGGFTGDATAGVDEKGNFYAGCQDYGSGVIRTSTSKDGGKTWGEWKTAQTAIDKPWIAGARDGTVYLTWLGSPGGFKRSLDYGATWESVISLGNLGHGTAIAPGNTGLVHIHYNQGSQLRYVRSKDWGATLDAGRNLAAMGTSCFGCSPRQHPIVGAGCDPAGRTVAATWSATMTGGDGNDDVWVVISRDNGDTWTKPIRANDNTAASRQFQSWVTADKYGRVHAVWTDTRNGGRNSIYYANTLTDKFGTNLEITDSRGPLVGFYGDYKGITIQGDDVLVAWADSRSGDNDIYFARGTGFAGPTNSGVIGAQRKERTVWTTRTVFDAKGARVNPSAVNQAAGRPSGAAGKYFAKP